MDINVHISAPGLEAAINALSQQLGGAKPAAQPLPAVAAPVTPQAAPAPAIPTNPVPETTAASIPASAIPTAPLATPATTTPAVTSIPTASAPAYTLEQLQIAVAPLLDAGKGPQLKALLDKYQVPRLPELPAEQYGAFATDLRGLGAKL